jgi:predicted transcriptional regulator YheO
MDKKIMEEINANIEEIWHRLEGIEHFLQEITMNGIFGRDVEESIVAIARALNKNFAAKYKEIENIDPAKV